MKICEFKPGFQTAVHSSGERMEAEWVKSSTDNDFFLPHVQHDTKNTQHLSWAKKREVKLAHKERR